jgi:hypothetical protein
MEPYLRVELTGNGRGQVSVVILLTPDHLLERHEFRTEIDQTQLPAIVSACRKIVAQFPILGLEQKSPANVS